MKEAHEMRSKLTWGIPSLIVACWLWLSQAIPLVRADTTLPLCGSRLISGFLSVSPTFAQDRTLLFRRHIMHTPWALLKSTDGGLSWAEISYPGGSEGIDGLFFSPQYAQDQTLYATYDGYLGRLDRSTDGGESWTTLTTPRTGGSTAATLAVYDINTLFLGYGGGQPGGYSEQGLFYSTDGGGSWERRFVGGVAAVALSPNYAQDGTILINPVAYHYDGGIFKSTDRGLTWQPSREGLDWGGDTVTWQIIFSPDFVHDHTVFCANRGGGGGGTYKSTDAGDHWTSIDQSLKPDFVAWPDLVLSPHYPQDQTLWVSGYPPWLLARSTDGGATWRKLSFYLLTPLAAPETCAPDGRCRVELIARDESASLGIYKSFDGGDTWQCLEESDAPPTPAPPIEIPEPATWLLLTAGLAGAGGWMRRRRAG